MFLFIFLKLNFNSFEEVDVYAALNIDSTKNRVQIVYPDFFSVIILLKIFKYILVIYLQNLLMISSLVSLILEIAVSFFFSYF